MRSTRLQLAAPSTNSLNLLNERAFHLGPRRGSLPRSCRRARSLPPLRPIFGIQPMPPSLNAYLRRGNFCGTFDHTKSAAACTMLIGESVISTSIGASRRGDHHLRRRTDVHAHDGVALLRGREERIPVAGVDRRVAEVHGVLGERDRVAALLGDAPHLGRHLLGVPHHRDRQRDEAARIRAAPRLDVPVVVRRARAPPRTLRRASRCA